MADDPVERDTSPSNEGMMATEIRRHSLKDFEADQAALRSRQEALEAELVAEPGWHTWAKAAATAQYPIRRYAETSEARDARRKKLIQRAIGDLAHLREESHEA